MVALRINASLVYPPYLFALLRSKEVRERIENMHVGTMIPHFKKGDFDKLHLDIPDDNTQCFIGDFYLRLSERIDLLARANESLEGIARNIFKSWFVDFDPVRAKAEGRDPEGMDTVTAALFPNDFEESRRGPIPKGWTMGRLDDLLVLQRGFDLPSTLRTPGAFPIIAASGPAGTHNESRVKGPGVVTGRSGVLGKVYWVDDDFWPLNTSLWVKDFKRATPAYAFQLLRLLDFASFNAGSAVPTLNRNHVHGLPTLLPPINLVRAFDEIATPLFQRIRRNNKQSEILADLRDTLLPRLISGKLGVPEAETMMEAVL
jgi:type I restriction enzyme S subunit